MSAPGHLRIEEITLSPGHEWVDESRGWRFIRLTRGAAYWLERNSPRVLNEGETMVLRPRASAVVRASQLNTVVLHGFQFMVDLLCGFFTVSERHFFDTHSQDKSASFLPSTHPVSETLGRLATASKPQADLILRAELLNLVISYFCEGGMPPMITRLRSPSAQDRFLQLMSKMPDLELIEHSPTELAALCSCSPRHFHRMFRTHFGAGPRSRQTELRLVKARHLLADTEMKVIQVAVECGYRSLSLFNSLFKRRFGLSPSEFRKKGGTENGAP